MNGFYAWVCKFLTCASLHVSKPTHYTLQESTIIKHFTHEKFNQTINECLDWKSLFGTFSK